MKKVFLISLVFLLFFPLIKVGAEGEGSMMVISPNELGLIYELGDTITIEWEQENMNWINIRVDGEQCSGSLVVDYNPITAESGTYDWIIPDDFYCLGKDVHFSLTGYNDSAGYIYYTSNTFQIISNEEKVPKISLSFEDVLSGNTVELGKTGVHLANVIIESYYDGYINLSDLVLESLDFSFTTNGAAFQRGNFKLYDNKTNQEVCSFGNMRFVGKGALPSIVIERSLCTGNMTIAGGEAKTLELVGDVIDGNVGDTFRVGIYDDDEISFSGQQPDDIIIDRSHIDVVTKVAGDSVDNYPGYTWTFDRDSYTPDDTAHITLNPQDISSTYLIDLYGMMNVVGEDSEKFLIKSNITARNGTIVSVDLDDFETSDNQEYEYSLLICSATAGCVEGYTNAGPISIVQDNDDNGNIEKITICHHTDSGNNQTLEVAKSAWPAHEIHGDTLGACSSHVPATPGPLCEIIAKVESISTEKTSNGGTKFYSVDLDVSNISTLDPTTTGPQCESLLGAINGADLIFTSAEYKNRELIKGEEIRATVRFGGDEYLGGYFLRNVKSSSIKINASLTNRLKGRILLQVEDHGEAWYVRPDNGRRIYMKDGATAYGMMRDLGLGISNTDLEKIPVGVEDRFECADNDGDGLCNKLEEGLGTDPNDDDSDNDGYNDGVEVRGGYNPLGLGSMVHNNSLVNNLRGKIVLQVQSRGEAWYINPDDGKRYYMTDGPAAYQIMRFLSLGITNTDLSQIDTE